MPTPPSAQITLSVSRMGGIVAVATGEQYPRAQTALEISGFRRRVDGTYALSVDEPEAACTTVTNLVRAPNRQETAVTTSSRCFFGDIAGDLVELLPGRWTAELEVYSHPLWQEDLVPWLWDAGELSEAVQTMSVPYAARLSDGADINLLLVERPGHEHGYVVGAFAPNGFDDNYEEPHAPRSAVLPASPALAARIVTDRFLPAYQQALHARRIFEVAAALGRVRARYDAWQAIIDARRSSDANPLEIDGLTAATDAFGDHAWYQFKDFLTHGPPLLERSRQASTAQPEDAEALDRLHAALEQGTAVQRDWHGRLAGLRGTPAHAEAKRLRNQQSWPAIRTWLADGDALTRQAQATTPSPPAPPLCSPPASPRALPPSKNTPPSR